MKRFPLTFSKPHRFSYAHVLLVHVLVILTGLAPTPMMADMLSTNVGHASGSAGGATAATAPAAAGGIDTAAATAQAHAHAQDMLSRNSMALDAVNAMQVAARMAASSMNNLGTNPNFPGQPLPNVPNGLGAGGLDIKGAPVGANAPTQSVQNAHTIVTIQQTQQQALLNWNTFNVGKDTTVKFDQSAGGVDVGTWIAFNKITDPTGNPTQILGSIQAQGQVYIINQNGIIFGGASEVNTHAMVVSALPLNDNLVTRGLLNNPDSQFLFSAKAQPAGTKGPTPAFTPPTLPASGKIGNVTVQAGAQITAPTSSANVGGRVVLVGPNVTNNGTISTPDGQTILAAGMQVGFDSHSSDDPSLRGLDVYVGDVGSYGGTATNAGLIETPRGSVVITGKNVNQNGFIDSSTSVTLNGRIDLLANYNAAPNTNYNASIASLGRVFIYGRLNGQPASATGIVTTGAGSVMQILPEWASDAKVVGTELALKSQINVQGLGIHFGAGSVVLAPNANVAISAGVWNLLLTTGATDLEFVNSSGQVYFDQGAVIDVAGSTAVASDPSEYLLTVTLRGAELADSALQRNGSLRGETVTVDLRKQGVRSDGTAWVGTPLANLTAYLGVVERTVGELTTAGGTVSIKAGSSVVMQSGASVDVSGGYQDFAGANVSTTLLASGSSLTDIANADPSVVYSGIYTGSTTVADTHWGTTTTTTGVFANPSHYEPGYSYGSNGGSVQIAAAAMALDGNLTGITITGPQQLDAAPQQSSLSLKFQAQQLIRSPLLFPTYSPTPPSIQFKNGGGTQTAADAFALDGSGTPVALRQDRTNNVFLSPDLLTRQGFASLLVDNSDGSITVPSGVSLTTAAAGSIKLYGKNLDIAGSLAAPGGQLELIAYDISPYTSALLRAQGKNAIHPAADSTRGKVTLGATAVLSTAGLVINDRADAPAPLSVPHEVATTNATGGTTYVSTQQGGTINIEAYSAELAAGSLLDVSGGLLANSAINYGNGGTLSIQAGNDPLLASVLGGHLTLGSTLRGFSGATGAALALQAPTIQVGSVASYPNTLLLQPDFFNNGGFSQFTLTGLGTDITPPAGAQNFAPAVVIMPGTIIQPTISSLLATIDRQGGGSSILLSTLVLPEGYRSAAKLDFEAPGITSFVNGLLVVRGNLIMGTGAQIDTDALGSVTLHGQTVEVLGEISAPGGRIAIKGSSHYPELGNSTTAFVTIHLGNTSRISAAGKIVLLNDLFDRRAGSVYAGGTIAVEGNIVTDAGAILDVSGTSGVLDLLPADAGLDVAARSSITQMGQLVTSVPVRIDSNGGTLSLKGGEFLFSRATLLGNAGGTNAQGGSLQIKSGHFVLPGGFPTDNDITLVVAQNIGAFTQPVFSPGQSVVGQSLGNGLAGQGYFGAASFLNGGFDSLSLAGNVRFSGAVDLNARGYLKVADGGVLGADALVNLTAPYVTLGRPLLQPTRDEELTNPYFAHDPSEGDLQIVFSPTFGTGQLVVTADLIETGFLSLSGVGQASLTARQELRGNSYLDIAGSLTITAGQVYPVTASTFTITAYNYNGGNGSITVVSSGVTPEFPLSGGGRLNLYAATITQGGTLRAPLGTIKLGWDGTGTAPIGLVTGVSVPVTQQITLSGGSVTSVSAIDPTTGAGVQIPYGLVKDGTQWIDPTGFDITSTGVPDKTIRLSALHVTTQAGSTLDIRGGGELYGYRWVEGNGGTQDILASNDKFAIIPGYASDFAPYAPFATTGLNVANLGGDSGYANAKLYMGDQIYLKGNALVAAGIYTLLPARYALLPGALLVTPSSGTPTDSLVKPGGAVLASGYRFNSLNPAAGGTLFQQFEIAPQKVVKVRAEYTDYSAADFIPAAQQNLSLPVSRTPLDAGYAFIGAQQTMQIDGGVSAAGSLTGRGGRVDISSPLDIVLAAPGAPPQSGKMVLNASLLSGWNAESLLIGGDRAVAGSTTTLNVRTNNLTLNAGVSLSGTELILVANQKVTLGTGAVISQTGTQTAADAFVVNGNGSLVRVSGVSAAQTSRTGVTSSLVPQLNVMAGVQISGTSITLDSSNATALDTTASLTGKTINLDSGRISMLLTNPGDLKTSGSLVLGGTTLAGLQNTAVLSLLSYTSIDLYGTGTFTTTGTLALHAGEIRGFNTLGGTTNITAQSILLDNSASGTAGATSTSPGTLNLTAATITIGQNALVANQFATVALNASSGGIVMQGTGSFRAVGDLNAVTPFFTAASNATQGFAANGVLTLTRPGGAQPPPGTLGLGSQISFEGSSVTANTDVLLPSGLISFRALTGNLQVGGRLDAGGVARSFFDVVSYTDGGQVTLTADLGNITLASTSVVNVAANAGGGNAGTFSVSAPAVIPTAGLLTMNGTLLGQAGAGGTAGSARIDVGRLDSFNTLNQKLNGGMFTNERNLRIRSGSVLIDIVANTEVVNARRFLLSVDQGSITVNGTINAAGPTGGRIDLIANGDVTLNSGALLSVKGTDFDDAGKGGEINLESGAQRNGVVGTGFVNVLTGSTIDLTVTNKDVVVTGGVSSTVAGSSAAQGKFSGILHLRAPQSTAANHYIQINPISGTIINPSSILIEGYKLYDYNQANVVIQGGAPGLANLTGVTLKTDAASGSSLKGDASAFMNNYDDIHKWLWDKNTGITALESQGPGVVVLAPGIEISNRGGNITLGVINTNTLQGSGAAYDWDLAGFRFGTKNAPGILSLRAVGNLAFYNTLSDGFDATLATSTNALEKQWTAPLQTYQNSLPTNTQSWSFRMAAGADLSAASFREVLPTSGLAANTGSLLLGKDAGQARTSGTTSGANALTATAIRANTATNDVTQSNRFQVIRTGTGNIEIAAARDVQLLNQFATIYTAGAQLPDATKVVAAGDFSLPDVGRAGTDTPDQSNLGAAQQIYPAQYSMAGGNITISAQARIVHLTKDNSGNLIADSSRELPNNWLMRRGYIDPTTGNYGAVNVFGTITRQVNDPSASTTWWVNFSNFFDGVGTLGGGNVTMQAGQNIENVSAHAPTNARAASGAPDAARFVELGGGDVIVRAGGNIDGGIYYVERGVGILNAGGAITTNSTRSPSLGLLSTSPFIDDPSTWLPTTLFEGKSSFDVKARGNLLLGPVANTFLLPQGINNKHWYKTYFSTFSATSSVTAASLGGSVTLREAATLVSGTSALPILGLWMNKELLFSTSNTTTAANVQPWLRLAETNVDPFNVFTTVMPAKLTATAYAGDVNVVGTINLSPSTSGQLNLLAAGSILGLQRTGASTAILNGSKNSVWSSATINLSDANPASVPGVFSPFAYYDFLNGSNSNNNNRTTVATFLNQKNATFAETGSTTGASGVVQAKQTLHAAGILHANDTQPVRIYAGTGDLSGLTLYSGKFASILAGRDITDIGLYIQNVSSQNVSVVASGRDITAYNANSLLRSQAVSTGNVTGVGENPKSGDIQISGPGTLQVLAGRNLNLGTGSNNSDGTGVGITSIGNGRNPYLPFAGANVIVGAGMGAAAAGVGGSSADFADLISYITTTEVGTRYLNELAVLLGVPSVNLKDPALTAQQQKQLALAVFYLALRDAGRDHNDPTSPNAGTYTDGFAAIAKLFPTTTPGNIQTQARDIRTKSGGDISILTPDGGLQLAATTIGSTLAPPGIITESGGSINIFANNSVDIGIARIFTLKGGDISIWSSTGDIAAGSSSKTVQSAPPTRVLIDPQSANVATDLAGLATGGGIGVLATVAGVRPGNVDLIAPVGAVDAGDAGIRATGNLNIAATVVLNAANISVGGTSSGTPAAPSVAAPSLGGLASAASSAGAATTATTSQAPAQGTGQQALSQEQASVISVEVLGYGGGSGADTEEERKRKRNLGNEQPGE